MPKAKKVKYWICDICIILKNLTTKYPNGGNTMSITACDYCDAKDEYCTPIVDFKESGNKEFD